VTQCGPVSLPADQPCLTLAFQHLKLPLCFAEIHKLPLFKCEQINMWCYLILLHGSCVPEQIEKQM